MKLIKSIREKFRKIPTLIKIIVVVALISNFFGTANDEEYQEEQNKTFDEIFLGKGHPIYYGSTESAISYAKKIGEKYAAVDIVREERYSEYTETTALSIKGFKGEGFDSEVYKSEGLITDIQIYLDNINETLNEKEAIELANKYLPSDIHKYYEKPTYKIYIPTDKSRASYKSRASHKIIEYNFNEVGEKAREDDDNFRYRSSIYVVLEERNNKVECIRICDGLPRWMNRPKANEYEVKEWSPTK